MIQLKPYRQSASKLFHALYGITGIFLSPADLLSDCTVGIPGSELILTNGTCMPKLAFIVLMYSFATIPYPLEEGCTPSRLNKLPAIYAVVNVSPSTTRPDVFIILKNPFMSTTAAPFPAATSAIVALKAEIAVAAVACSPASST